MKKDRKTDRRAVAMYKAGVPVDELCAFLHIGAHRLYSAVAAAGIPRRRGPDRKQRITSAQVSEAQISEAVRLYLEGETVYSIVVTTLVPRGMLMNALKEQGINPQSRNRAARKTPRTTTNVVMLQRSHGKNFVELCNGVLSGELDL